MISGIAAEGIIKILLAIVMITALLVVTRRNLNSLVFSYAAQSFFIALIPIFFYYMEKNVNLWFIALLTLVTKVIIIPIFIKRVQKSVNIKRDLEFHYISSTGSTFLSLLLILLMYSLFTEIMKDASANNLFFLGSVLGVSLVFIGMLVLFSRKKVITKIIGYLIMENGVLLFSLFFPELPFIVEVLITVDLLILVMLSALLAFGVDSSIEKFHEKINDPLGTIFKGDDEE